MKSFQLSTSQFLLVRAAICLVVVSLSMNVLSGCSRGPESELAVSKLSKSQAQATPFLALNSDKPGTPVDVQKYLVPGKYTIVYYFSPFSDQSLNLEPGLMQLAQVKGNIAVRTVNVNRPGVQGIDWQSPIMQSGEIQSLPYVRIYDPTQMLRAHGRPAYTQVVQWIRYPLH